MVHRGPSGSQVTAALKQLRSPCCPPCYAYLIMSSFLQSRCVSIITRLINSDINMWVLSDSAWDTTTHKNFPHLSVFAIFIVKVLIRLDPSYCIAPWGFQGLGWTGMVHMSVVSTPLSVSHATSRKPRKRSALRESHRWSKHVTKPITKNPGIDFFGDLDLLGIVIQLFVGLCLGC